MSKQATNQYLRTKVLTAGPAQLQLMLYDGAIRFAEQAKAALQQKDYEKSYGGISKAQKIVIELINGLRKEIAPEICDRQSALYTFVYRRLMEGNLEKSPAKIDEALDILRHQRETWILLMKKLAEQKSSQDPSPEDTSGLSLAG